MDSDVTHVHNCTGNGGAAAAGLAFTGATGTAWKETAARGYGFDRIIIDPKALTGKPVVRGTRIQSSLVGQPARRWLEPRADPCELSTPF